MADQGPKIDLSLNEVPQVLNSVDQKQATLCLNPGCLSELVSLREGLAYICKHGYLVPNLGHDAGNIRLIRKGQSRWLQHRLVELKQLPLLCRLDLLLHLQGQELDAILE